MANVELLEKFHRAMLNIYEMGLKLKPKYKATALRHMVGELGGKAAADRLLASGDPSTGFGSLLGYGAETLKISLEYLVLQNPWRELFEPEQLAVARKRLSDVKCDLPPEDSEDVTTVAAEIATPAKVVYFNNCKNRPHETLFGQGAFYDLNISGNQATQALNLQCGQLCAAVTIGENDLP